MVWTASGETWYAKENLPPYLNYTTYVLVKRRPMHVFIDKPSRFYLQWSQWRRLMHVFIDKPSKFYLVKSRLKCSLRGYLTR